MIDNRLSLLDGFLVIAILMVMIFHYYSRFLGDLYTYIFDVPTLFSYGYLGVELFFVISGFVITLSLTKSDSFLQFFKKRFARLIPGMVVCSLTTFFIVRFFVKGGLFLGEKTISNLLISNTFISPKLINWIFDINPAYIDGAYWSLWIELSFYFLVAITYFADKKNILRNFSVLILLGVISSLFFKSEFGFHISKVVISEPVFMLINRVFLVFNFFDYGIWFLIGMVLKDLYFDKNNNRLKMFISLLFIFQIAIIFNLYTIAFTLATFVLFYLFVYRPHIISFLGHPLISKIGIASYSIYLIHQVLGVLLINKLSPFFGSYNWLLGIIAIFISCFFGVYSYNKLENPLSKKLRCINF